MKKATTILFIFLAFCITELSASNANDLLYGKKKVNVTTSETDAAITINGKIVGMGAVQLTVLKNSCVTVIVSKTGYFTYTIQFCNQRGMPVPPKSYHVVMDRDDAFDASVQTDIANIDMDIRTKKDMDTAWKLLNQIVLKLT